MTEHRIALELETEQPSVERNTSTVLHAVVDLSAIGRGADGERSPISVIFTLDNSQSMSGEPLEQVIASTRRLLELLRPIDSAGIVSFSTTAKVVAPLSLMHERARKKAVRAVSKMRTDYSTNMAAGLDLARSLLPTREMRERQAILLLSDGVPNVGERTPEGLGRMARSMRPDISVSTLGFGRDHDEHVLSSIAECGSGRYHFIPSVESCRKELGAALGAQGDVVADHIELTITPRPGCEILCAVGTPAQPSVGGGLRVMIPDLAEGGRHLVALRLRVKAPEGIGRFDAADVTLSYVPAGARPPIRIDRALGLESAERASAMSIAPLHKVLALRAGEEQRRARALADGGNYDAAATLLDEVVRMIEAAPRVVRNDGSLLAECWEQLIDDAAVYRSVPSRDSYKAYCRGQQLAVGGNVGVGQAAMGAFGRALSHDAAGAVRSARLVNACDGSVHTVARASLLLGRSRTCDVVLSTSRASRQHACIDALEGAHWIKCLGSANGVWVNGERVDMRRLSHGDRILVGEIELRYESGPT